MDGREKEENCLLIVNLFFFAIILDMEKTNILINKIISLCKRRGFIFPSSEIYGGFESCYDYGPLGVELKNNIKKVWWQSMVQENNNVAGLDASILMNPKVWQASGHLSVGFADQLVECVDCHKRFKNEDVEKKKCPECQGELSKPRQFNLMMKTFVGSVEDQATTTYLRAETCQGIYVNFLNILQSSRLKIPFGVAQIGKSFRNEVTTKNFIFRTREFEQMEMQFFVHPKEANHWFNYWLEQRLAWYQSLDINKKNLRAYEVPEKDRAHYAKRQVDIEYHFPWGWQEIEGVHNRGDWDLSRHSQASKQELLYFNQESKEKFIPFIIETSVGVERSLLTFLIDGYQEIEGGRSTTTEAIKETETFLKLNKKISPIKIAILPLSKKEEITKPAKNIYDELKKYWMIEYDETGSIGKRYRRQDEIGTPYCLTVDFDSLNDGKVTIRDRDSMKQERISADKLIAYFNDKFL